MEDGRERTNHGHTWRNGDYSEAFRFACEARHLAAMPTDADRKTYLEVVRVKRGEDQFRALRRAAWALMKTQAAA
jgi:hypothetical protein